MISCSLFVNNACGCANHLRENAWKKRGISCIPTTFGVSFGCTFLNQVSDIVRVCVCVSEQETQSHLIVEACMSGR